MAKLNAEDMYTDEVDPNPKVNPKKPGVIWINYITGDIFVCKDNTYNNNVWIETGFTKEKEKALEEKFEQLGKDVAASARWTIDLTDGLTVEGQFNSDTLTEEDSNDVFEVKTFPVTQEGAKACIEYIYSGARTIVDGAVMGDVSGVERLVGVRPVKKFRSAKIDIIIPPDSYLRIANHDMLPAYKSCTTKAQWKETSFSYYYGIGEASNTCGSEDNRPSQVYSYTDGWTAPATIKRRSLMYENIYKKAQIYPGHIAWTSLHGPTSAVAPTEYATLGFSNMYYVYLNPMTKQDCGTKLLNEWGAMPSISFSISGFYRWLFYGARYGTWSKHGPFNSKYEPTVVGYHTQVARTCFRGEVDTLPYNTGYFGHVKSYTGNDAKTFTGSGVNYPLANFPML